MNTDSNLRYTSTTPSIRGAFTGYISRVGTEPRIGYINPEYGQRRAVIYTSDQLHPDEVWNGSADHDTMFGYDDLRDLPFALGGEVSELTCKVVKMIAHYTLLPFVEFRGIRVSKSDKPEYASKIVFQLPLSGGLEYVCEDVASVIFGDNAPFALDVVEEDKPSGKESEDMLSYSGLDY